jgi:hypothetical protein
MSQVVNMDSNQVIAIRSTHKGVLSPIWQKIILHHAKSIQPSSIITQRPSGRPSHSTNKADRISLPFSTTISPNNLYINPAICSKPILYSLIIPHPLTWTVIMEANNQPQDPSPAYEASQQAPRSKSASREKRSLLQKISHSYTKNWKPLLFAKESWQDEYNFSAGGRQGVYTDMNGGGPRQR